MITKAPVKGVLSYMEYWYDTSERLWCLHRRDCFDVIIGVDWGTKDQILLLSAAYAAITGNDGAKIPLYKVK